MSISADRLTVFDPKDELLRLSMSYIITLGGDGTILYAAKQFYTTYIPPIIAFALVSTI